MMTYIKRLIFISSIVVGVSGLASERELYDCVYLEEESSVHGLKVLEVTKGRRITYELEVEYIQDRLVQTKRRKVNLIENYEGRVQTYGTGNTRVKIDRAIPISSGKFKAFARLPDFDIHSKNWVCKGDNWQEV